MLKFFRHGAAAAALLLAIVSMTCARAAAVETTLSVRTQDGLVVLHGPEDEMRQAMRTLQSELPPGATNRDLLRFLYHRWPAGQLKADAYTDITGSGTGKGVEPAVIETTVRQAVERGDIPNIMGRELFEAYMLIRMRGDTLMMMRPPPPGSPQIQHTVFVFSSAWGTGMSGIFIDGDNAFNSKAGSPPPPNGYRFVVLDPEGGKILNEAEFKTFEDLDSGNRMEQFLAGQPAGAVLLGAVQWGPGVYLTGGAVNAMHDYGSTNEPDSQILSSHALIGRKGLAAGAAVEAAAVNSSSDVVLFDNRLYMAEDKIKELKKLPGLRIVAIAGTAPDDKVVLIGRDF
jgi:hypothetical protein